MSSKSPLLTLDTASPTVSLAIGDGDRVLASRSLDLRQSSERLLRNLQEALGEADLQLTDLKGILVLRGPGSFTGLRIGLGTVLGLHQALGIPAAAVSTLEVLASSVADRIQDGDGVVAVVDAIRGEWMAQTFVLEGGEPQPVDLATLKTPEDLEDGVHPIVGFGADTIPGNQARWTADPLAPAALKVAAKLKTWDPGTLVHPIYFRPPATTPPKRAPRPQKA